MVRPSCPALVIHDDDAVDLLRNRKFTVVVLGVNLATRRGLRTLDYLRGTKESVGCGILILGDPDPQIRTYGAWADETLLKPVDPAYVATRARTYCDCPP